MLTRILLLALAGALGTLARAGVYATVARLSTGLPLFNLPLATLAVNVLGSLAFGLIWPLAESTAGSARMSVETRAILLAGFMGAFTTFSTFAFEIGDSLRRGAYGPAGLTLIANCVLGVSAFLLGTWLSRMVFGSAAV